MNIHRATDILQQLIDQGVSTFCLCPGARNAPFVALLEANPHIETLTFYDERSAGFFALGRARRDKAPVVVITTSGTAVSELLSPVIEAWHSYVPIVVISADRPKRMRGTGAPQTIEQSQLFQNFVENSWDIEASEQVEIKVPRRRPCHINICFDEPLLDSLIERNLKIKVATTNLQSNPSVVPAPTWSLKNCLIVVGGLEPNQRQDVWDFIIRQKTPVFAEALSGLRPLARACECDHFLQTDSQVRNLLKDHDVKSVLRLGDVPVGRFWRDLEDLKQIAVYSLSDKNFLGLSHGHIFCSEISKENLMNLEVCPLEAQRNDVSFTKTSFQIQSLYQAYPQSEVALLAKLNQVIPSGDCVFVGNSLSVREWDLVDQSHSCVYATRGVNGIDGQMSTALGLQEKGKPLWVILGDLTTLYDFSAFWLTPWLRDQQQQVNVVVINNRGGQIFSRIFSQKMFLNSHNLNFRPIADMWGWHYQKLEKMDPISLENKLNLIELLPDNVQSFQFWQALEQIW